jgi:hypothetical protein
MTLRCFFSVFIGGVVVAGFSGLLSLYGEAQDTVAEISMQTTKSPDNISPSIQELSDRLARGAEALAKISPAAGN